MKNFILESFSAEHVEFEQIFTMTIMKSCMYNYDPFIPNKTSSG